MKGWMCVTIETNLTSQKIEDEKSPLVKFPLENYSASRRAQKTQRESASEICEIDKTN
jgi:hypothetical protein